MPLSRRSRTARLVSIAAGALAPLLTVGLIAPTAAAAPPAPPTTSAAASGVNGGAHRVTLITGDTVTVTDAGAGRQAATVDRGAGRDTVTFTTTEVDGQLSITPSDAVPYLVSGALDKRLFDVTALIADGYAGKSTLPLIAAYADPAAPRIQSVDATTPTRALPSIGGVALAAQTDRLAEVWRSLTPGTASIARAPSAGSPATLSAGISRIWLDGRVHATLEQSVSQIGAPSAWSAGYEGQGVEVAVLDTGVDATHPDLKGRIGEQRDFSGSTTGTVDHFGHGTHVAATIAGTGAASSGRERGVAPKSSLLIGKVLGDDGYGYDSAIIEGMQWAADEGARVINMSLGGGATDGTDPISLALNDISEKSGALFVVAAGNEGTEQSVGSPGAAADALTVGAVDKNGELADFSSRGPRVGDNGLKPEISAPGVDIVAARAAGTTMGEAVDQYYTTASGTSMATPHVAGAAVLLAQEHPDWTGAELKDALVSSATPNPKLSVWQQGSGQVDLRRAIPATVTASGVADFATVSTDDALTRTVTYRNTGDTALELSLKLDVRDIDDARKTASAFSAPSSVTVPAGGSADVAITLAAGSLERGRWSGALEASAAGETVARTAIGAVRSGPKHRVIVRSIDFRGTEVGSPVITLFGDHPGTEYTGYAFNGDQALFEVEEGEYLLHGLVEQNDPQDPRIAEIVDPNIVVDRDMTITMDARKTRQIRIDTPKPAQQQAVYSYYVHRVYPNGREISHGVMQFGYTTAWVTPTKPVKEGSFEFSSRWQLVRPSALLAVSGLAGTPAVNLLGNSPVFQGIRTLPLVAPGPELAGVRGKAVVIKASDQEAEARLTDAAAKAGAAAVIFIRPVDSAIYTVFHPDTPLGPIPAMVTTEAEGAKILARASTGRATVRFDLTRSSPYLYDVQQVSTGRIPAQIVYTVSPSNSQRITTRYSDTGGFAWADEQRFTWRPWATFAWNDTHRTVPTPSTREDWVSSGDSIWQHRVSPYYNSFNWGALQGGFTSVPRSYDPGRSNETWLSPVLRPSTVAEVPSYRKNDALSLRIPEYVDSDGHFDADGATTESARLYRDGRLLAELPNAVQDVTTTRNLSDYRLDLVVGMNDPEWRWSVGTETSWWFRSGRPDGDAATSLPLLHVDYSAPVDELGMATRKAHTLPLAVRTTDGSTARGASVKAWTSSDRGATWTAAPVIRSGGGFSVVVPKGSAPVSLRVDASTDSHTRVRQTVIDAYGRH